LLIKETRLLESIHVGDGPLDGCSCVFAELVNWRSSLTWFTPIRTMSRKVRYKYCRKNFYSLIQQNLISCLDETVRWSVIACYETKRRYAILCGETTTGNS